MDNNDLTAAATRVLASQGHAACMAATLSREELASLAQLEELTDQRPEAFRQWLAGYYAARKATHDDPEE